MIEGAIVKVHDGLVVLVVLILIATVQDSPLVIQFTVGSDDSIAIDGEPDHRVVFQPITAGDSVAIPASVCLREQAVQETQRATNAVHYATLDVD